MGNEGPEPDHPELAEVAAGQIAGSVTAVIVRCVERVAGQPGVARLMERAGDPRDPLELCKGTTWTSYDLAVSLFRAGIEVTDDPRFAHQVGEEMLRQYEGSEVAALFRSLGSPGEVLRNVALSATKFSTATRLEAVEIGDDYAIIEAWAIEGFERDATFCAYTAGILTQSPVLFGMSPAQVVETRCQRHGAARCNYTVRWDRSTAPDADPQRRIEHLEAQLSLLTKRFESMQKTTRELVSAEGLEHVLAAIPHRAAHAVRATRHLLAVYLAPGDLRLHEHGFASDDEARLVAQEILATEPDDRDGSRLIVDVTSGTRHFGRLAALYPPGARFFPAERRLLEAYAATAAAALNVATALEEARRQNETARALLALASSLTDARTVDAVAQTLATAIPAVVGSPRASVLVWDADEARLTYRGIEGVSAELEAVMRATVLLPEETPELQRMLSAPTPMVLDATDASPALCAVLHAADVERVCIVPLLAHGDFHGVVTAPIERDFDLAPDMWERLQGLANQGATALENARLVEQVHHQALHDSLTGVPNRLLLEDRLGTALATANRGGKHVGLLFVDLDRFKAVNDTYGHGPGDVLLQQVAYRLSQSVRASDTVARLGGDEFVILLSEVDTVRDAQAVAEKILEAMRVPYEIRERVLSVSASIGVTVATRHDDVESLLNHADKAMYRAKSAGRDQVVIAA
ncbi:MAG: hypothetical protein JWL83_2289 [Actinomycetia bacterium]|nr:hypothetical protein [Actinomycetes bacterium]